MTSLAVALLAIVTLCDASRMSAQTTVIVTDSYNRKVHVASGANERRPVGGLAKIATTMVTLDWAEASKVGVNVLATVPDYALQMGSLSPLGLQAGDRLTVRDLIYATMMSDDDIPAITLGDFVGRDHLQRLGRAGQPIVEFVRQMNSLAEREGATHTRFTNPQGYEGGRGIPYSTAADIARLGLYAVSRPALRFYTNQSSRTITVFRGAGSLTVALTNTNRLLGVNRIDGVKAATSQRAGACLVISAERPSTAVPQADGSSMIYRHRMLVVILGSANPYGEAQALLNQGWAAYDRWVAAGRPITDKKQMLNYY